MYIIIYILKQIEVFKLQFYLKILYIVKMLLTDIKALKLKWGWSTMSVKIYTTGRHKHL